MHLQNPVEVESVRAHKLQLIGYCRLSGLPSYLLLISAGVVVSTESQAQVNISRGEHNKVIETIDRASTPFELSAAYCALLERASDETLQKLMIDLQAGVAMQAAWERVRRSINKTAKSPNRSNLKDSNEIEQFLGVVKERVKKPLPVWWERTIREAVPTDPKQIVFPVSAHRSYRKNSLELYAPDGISVEDQGQQYLIRTEKDKFTLPKASFDDRCIEPSLSVLVTPQFAYFATHPGVRSFFALKRLNRKSGELLEFPIWTGPVVFQSGIILPGERLGDHVVSIEQTTDAVFVWGAERHSVYLEAFSTGGKNIFRFNSSY
jgi:hypothetical protein